MVPAFEANELIVLINFDDAPMRAIAESSYGVSVHRFACASLAVVGGVT
jgi:hypothetical protein